MYTDVEAEWLPLKKVLRYLSPKLLAGASGRLGWEAVRGVHAGVCTVRAHVIGVAARVCTAGKHASDRPQGETCSQETPSPLLPPPRREHRGWGQEAWAPPSPASCSGSPRVGDQPDTA